MAPVQPSAPAQPQVVAQTPGISVALNVTEATNINTDPGCSKTKNPDTAPNCIPGLDVTMAYATQICMAPDAV